MRKLGKPKVLVAAFRSQMESFYLKAFPIDGTHSINIEQKLLDRALGKDFSLCSMDADTTGFDFKH